MKKNSKRGIAFTLASLITISSMSGCAKSKGYEEYSISSSSKDVLSSIVHLDNKDDNLTLISDDDLVPLMSQTSQSDSYDEILSTEVIYDEREVLDKLDLIYEKSGLNYQDVLEEGCSDKIVLASALLKKAEDLGVSRDDILRELENIMIFRQIPTDFSEEVWEELFGNLCETVSKDINVTEYYYPLANVVHLYSCSENHEVVYDTVTCDILQEKLADYMSDESYVNYVYKAVIESGNEKLISTYNRLQETGIDMLEYLTELDTLFMEAINPTDYDINTWNLLFGRLNKTLSEYENLYDTYYELARFIHMLDCEFKHEVQDCGTTKCEGLEYILKY